MDRLPPSPSRSPALYEELPGRKGPEAGGPSRRTLTGSGKRADTVARLTGSPELDHGRIVVATVYFGS